MLHQLQSYDQSRFWQRLQALADDAHYSGDKEALAHLISSVRKVSSRAARISAQICHTMPHYTLHEERVNGKDYQRDLRLSGISHGRGAPWLRRQLIDGGQKDRFDRAIPAADQPRYVLQLLRQTHPDIRPLFKSEIANRQLKIPLLRLKIKQEGRGRLVIGAWSLGFPDSGRRWDREPDGREEELRVTLDWGTDDETGQ